MQLRAHSPIENAFGSLRFIWLPYWSEGGAIVRMHYCLIPAGTARSGERWFVEDGFAFTENSSKPELVICAPHTRGERSGPYGVDEYTASLAYFIYKRIIEKHDARLVISTTARRTIDFNRETGTIEDSIEYDNILRRLGIAKNDEKKAFDIRRKELWKNIAFAAKNEAEYRRKKAIHSQFQRALDGPLIFEVHGFTRKDDGCDIEVGTRIGLDADGLARKIGNAGLEASPFTVGINEKYAGGIRSKTPVRVPRFLEDRRVVLLEAEKQARVRKFGKLVELSAMIAEACTEKRSGNS